MDEFDNFNVLVSDFIAAQAKACLAVIKATDNVIKCSVKKFTKMISRKRAAGDVTADFDLVLKTTNTDPAKILNEFKNNFDTAAFKSNGGGDLEKLTGISSNGLTSSAVGIYINFTILIAFYIVN